ncbi:MAG: L,D-transpeptidase family protein [Chloroflexi bacterium]|uniref:L,D-transpeptidase family protein n=1 Tax=Candidatus Flexifilum breve TaxID=3140694 RepID=UPI003135BBB3|nr:L,D-transpeptidase family protein [Chloroflexota bacterium]
MMNRPTPYVQQRPIPPRRRRKRSNPPFWLIGGAAAVIAFVGLLGVALIALIALSPQRVMAGVQIAGVNVGDVTVANARAAVETLASSPVAAVDGERRWNIPLSDLGATLDVEATLKAIESAPVNTQVTPIYTVDLNLAQSGLYALSESANIAAIPGDPPQIGRAMDIPVMLDRLRVDVSGELADGVFELDMIEVQPEEETAANYTGATSTHIVASGEELGLIARRYGVTVDDIMALNRLSDPNFIWVGQELTIPAAGEYVPENVPAAPAGRGKSILVSNDQQRIYAYEDGALVWTRIVSTGLPATPTVTGDYNIYVKYVADDMSGPDYFLPQVPYTMYFYQGYAIHGTYWHNKFGRPMSHGCVNLPVGDAQWIFDWAEVGTLVRVI